MIWLSLAVALLKLTNLILDLVRTGKAVQSGKDAEIAKEAAAILSKTQTAKEIMQQVTGLSEAQVDATLRELEP